MTPVRRRPKGPGQPFHWFKGASVRELYDRLSAAGPDTARLEVRTNGDHMTFRVLADGEVTASAQAADINDSFLCPPRCP